MLEKIRMPVFQRLSGQAGITPIVIWFIKFMIADVEEVQFVGNFIQRMLGFDTYENKVTCGFRLA